jgi:hypothetical protein
MLPYRGHLVAYGAQYAIYPDLERETIAAQYKSGREVNTNFRNSITNNASTSLFYKGIPNHGGSAAKGATTAARGS